MSLTPLTKTPKSQLTAEQPSTKKTGSYQKDILHPKTEKKTQQDGRRGTFEIKSYPIPAKRATTNWKIIISQRFSDRSESSESHIRLPSQGVFHWEEEPPEHLALKAKGLDRRNSTRLGETERPPLGGTRKVSCTPGPREKAVTS